MGGGAAAFVCHTFFLETVKPLEHNCSGLGHYAAWVQMNGLKLCRLFWNILDTQKIFKEEISGIFHQHLF